MFPIRLQQVPRGNLPLATISRRMMSSERTIIGKILHGTASDDQPSEKTIEEHASETHSKLLARGKYVHELQIHQIKPEASDDYAGLVSERYNKIANEWENQVNLVGSWQTLVGELDQAVHIWEYRGYPGYHHTMNRLRSSEEHRQFERKLAPMLRGRRNEICLEFAFWLTSPPSERGKVYELRTYELKPGRLLDWEQHWKKGLECRRQFCQPVGAWFTQLGRLNTVHHMWAYSDLHDRKITREAAWNVDGWAQTVWNTVPLINSMNTQILQPMSHSPLH